MVFSTDNLYKQENIIDNTPINNIIKVSENTSLFIDSLHYILEENLLVENELSKYNISTYKQKKLSTLQEDNIVSDILKNGINIKIQGPDIKGTVNNIYQKVKTNLTIENIIKFIITGFIKIVVRIWREFEVICMNLVSKNSQIRRLGKKINDIGVDIHYNAPMFTYTHILDDTNRVDPDKELSSIYDELAGFISTFRNLKNARDIELAIDNFNSKASLDEDYYSEIRGQLLGTNNFIAEEDFNEALFKYFRNGASTTTDNNIITPESIRARYASWEKAPKIIRVYNRYKDKLENAGNSLIKKVEKYNLDSYIKEVPVSVLDLYSNLVNRYAHKIKNTCNIFLLFYSQKLDAAKDELALNTKILFKVAEYITREGL